PAEAAGRDPRAIEITLAAPTDVAEIEALARQGVARVAVPVSAAAGLPAQVKTPDDVLRSGKNVIARLRGRRGGAGRISEVPGRSAPARRPPARACSCRS